MANNENSAKLTFQEPAIYEIKVVGELDISWSKRLEGVNITKIERPDGEIRSVLVGRLGGQAALTGVINTLYNLRLPVISVNCLDRG